MKLTIFHLALALAASLAMVAADVQKLQIPGCKTCSFTDCFKDPSEYIYFLTEAPKLHDGVRTFKIDQPKGAPTKLEVNSTDSRVAGKSALIRITNQYKAALLLEIDFSDDGKNNKDTDPDAARAQLEPEGPQYFKIDANSVCSASLTEQHKSVDITLVQAYMNEEA